MPVAGYHPGSTSAIISPCCTCSYPATGWPAIGHGGGRGTPVEGGRMRGMEIKHTGVPLPPALLELTPEQRAGLAEFIEEWQIRNIPLDDLVYLFRDWTVQHQGALSE